MTHSQKFFKIKQYVTPTVQQNEELNMYQIFKPFYLILTFFGLFPYSVTYNKSRERLNIIPNSIFFNGLCAGFYVTSVSAFSIMHTKYLFTSGKGDALTNVLLTQLNCLLEIGTLVILSFVVYISTFLNRFTYVKILNSICAIWLESKNYNQNEILGRLRFQINVLAIGSILIITIIHLCVNCTRSEGSWKIILVLFTGVLPSVIQTIMLAFHYILVMMIVAILTDINEQLFKLTKQRKATEDIYFEVETRQTTFSLKRLELIYTKAYEVKCDVNEAFQATILFSTLQSFHCIISEAHTIFHGVMEHTDIFTLHNIVNCIFWIVLQLLKVYSSSHSGNALKNKVTKIGQTLHAIPTEKQDLKTFMEVQHFATMMNYQGFVLTVYGYFSLNASLMSAMIANVTMYLIILIQFDKTNTTSEYSAAV